MTINTEFNVGDIVYYIVTYPSFFEGMFVDQYRIKSGPIVSIQTNTTIETEVTYQINDPRHIFRNYVFRSMEDAKQYLYELQTT